MKEEILKIANQYLEQKIADKINGYKNFKTFINSLNDLSLEEIRKILKEKPEYSNKESNGLHAIHYAALTKNIKVFDLFFDEASKNGLDCLPKTSKDNKRIPKGISFLGFCMLMDLDEVYAKSLTLLVSPEEQDFKHHLKFSFLYNSRKIASFLNKIIPNEYQNTMYCAFMEDNKNTYTSNVYQIFMKNFNKNPNRFEDLGVDVTFKKDGSENYFTKTLNTFIQTSEELQSLEQEELKKLDNTINFFIGKGMSVNEKDGLGVSPLDLLERFAENKKYDYNHSLLEKIINESKVNSLGIELATKAKEKSKFKI